MNERIRELIAKSTWVQFVEGVGHKEVFDKEQFAELIIKDCISQIAIIGLSNEENEDISWAVDLAILNIKEKFGVK